MIFIMSIFIPSLYKKYISLRKSILRVKKKKRIDSKKSENFGPNFLAAHFFGDIVKEKPKLMKKFKSL